MDLENTKDEILYCDLPQGGIKVIYPVGGIMGWMCLALVCFLIGSIMFKKVKKNADK